MLAYAAKLRFVIHIIMTPGNISVEGTNYRGQDKHYLQTTNALKHTPTHRHAHAEKDYW